MVAKIQSGKSLTGALHYNEHKVRLGKAELIGASLYVKDHRLLSFEDKLGRLANLASRNERTQTNTVHISLNFDLGEQLPPDLLLQVADAYMMRLGFGEQPYLVYQHRDAGHPHIHLLSTNIRADGSRISLHNIGRLKSEPARKAVEQEFNLVQAGQRQSKATTVQTEPSPLVYGRTDTRHAIGDIVHYVVQQYRFTSLPELNAVLGLYSVMADRGGTDTVMYRNSGLRYWAADAEGHRLGVPIKASRLYRKPVLKVLEDRFRLNEVLRKPCREPLRSLIDRALQAAKNRAEWQRTLHGLGVTAIFWQNEEGRVYGVTYVDRNQKAVFNGSDLGKGYSIAAVLNTLTQNAESSTTTTLSPSRVRKFPAADSPPTPDASSGSLLEELLSPVQHHGEENLFERKKRRKKRKLNF